jgi:hypothetical protein
MLHTSSRLLAAAALSVGLVFAVTTPASAATRGCEKPVNELDQALIALGGTRAGTRPPSNQQAEQLRQRGAELYGAALREHPECKDDFAALVAQLAAAARGQAAIHGTPFLGPIGWLWNNVYYRVFSGNDVMMALFGWALLLSPVVLVVATRWVLRGAREGLHKPYVPEHLRVDM